LSYPERLYERGEKDRGYDVDTPDDEEEIEEEDYEDYEHETKGDTDG
jgi:hypothetical protein